MTRINLRNRRAVILGLVVFSVVIFVAGIGAAFLSRHDKLCKDGKAPVAQKAAALEPTLYLCHNGQIVTK
jgi:hypothetical protein